ncbi:MAG: UDP-glucose/GDP-mannose dehydrogenase family protein [Deltaproteobacteria bacterium]|nr:UDP-glucose/GDP-mannose dehydrogenase family protein [Deltaproteobacteria bacterium]
MRVTIIGTGYVGTVAGACFAETGNHVCCVDKDASKVAALSAGKPIIYEPQLEQLVRRGLARGNLSYTTSVRDGTRGADVVFMTVGTPSNAEGDADLGFLEEAARETARAMDGSLIVVNKSTVPVGTHRLVAEWLRSEAAHPFEVVSNPEFLREGSAVRDFLRPERVVLGTGSKTAFETLKQLYLPFVTDERLILETDPVSAELTKYACNSFLATRISFMNELSRLCEALGADIESVRHGMALDARIGRHFLQAGIGYGGSCFPKDIRALLATAKDAGVPLSIVAATEDVNETQKTHLMSAVHRHFGASLAGRTVALWGLAFKPDTDDVREAPALILARELARTGARVRAFDPVAGANARALLHPEVELCESAYEAAENADGLVLATEWPELVRPDYPLLKRYMREHVLFDGRNALSMSQARGHGFAYYGVGRGAPGKKGARRDTKRLPLGSGRAA